MVKILSALVLFALFVWACTKKTQTRENEIWIYTSLYSHVIQDLEVKLQRHFPNVKFKWYQSGSENVAAKVRAEMHSGRSLADLIITSDPFWYEELKENGKLLAVSANEAPNLLNIEKKYRDPKDFYAIMRIPVMVISYHADSMSEADAPKSFEDLTLPRFKNKVSMGSPLESGTAFTTVALLSRKMGWSYFSKLRENGVLVAGGNSAVVARVERKERPVGILLLENALTLARRNSKIRIVYPKEGAILIPSPVAVLEGTANPGLAKQVFNFMLSESAQNSVVLGDMYPILANVAGPREALLWKKLVAHSFEWSPEILGSLYKTRNEIKKKFSDLVLESN